MSKGERLKELRKALGLKQYEMANQIGISRVLMNLLESNEKPLTKRNAKYICEKYNVNVEWLETGNGDMFLRTEAQKNNTIADELHSFVDKAITDEGDMLEVLRHLNEIQKKQSE